VPTETRPADYPMPMMAEPEPDYAEQGVCRLSAGDVPRLALRADCANEQGWLWSEVLGAYMGTWQGKLYGRQQTWLRLYDAEGDLVLLSEEREAIAQAQTEQARQRAEAAERRVAELEAELKRLRGG